MTTPTSFGTGALDSVHDPRTVQHSDLAKLALPPVKYKIDFATYPHKNQLKVGICTAASVTSSAEKYFGTSWRGSMEWLYKMGKVFIDGNVIEGSAIFTMLKAAQKFGIPSEDKFPSNCNRTYAEFIANTTITQAMLDDAAQHKIPGYASVALDPTSLMNAIYSSKSGIITRMALGNNWWTDTLGNITWDKTKLQPIRAPEIVLSGHAIDQIGYDATGNFILIDRNSWGEEWCDAGDALFYLDIQKPFFTEAWVITDKEFFVHDLRMGDSNPDIKRLQKFLNAHGFQVAPTGNGSPGNETEYFGLLTFNAVVKFQKANNIPATGFVGTITRTRINQLL